MKQKIVHVIPSLKRGGAEVVLLTLVQKLHTSAEHHVIYCTDGPLKQEFEKLTATLHKVTLPGSTRTPLFAFKLYYLFKKIQPTVIHTLLWTPNLWGRIVARILNIPCVAALHTIIEHEGKLRTFIDKIIPASPAAYVAVSPTIITSLIEHKKFTKEKVILIPNGITLTQPTCSKNISLIKDEKLFMIGSVGRFVPVKQYDVLLRVFAEIHVQYQHTRLVLIGYGEQEAALRSLAHTLHIETAVHFIINQPAQEYYQLFDCFVQTSAQEGLSLAVLEAMGNGISVIAPQGAATHPVINHLENGLLWGSTSELKNLLQLVIQNKNLSKNLALQARNLIEKKYSSNIMAQNYSKLFEQLDHHNGKI